LQSVSKEKNSNAQPRAFLNQGTNSNILKTAARNKCNNKLSLLFCQSEPQKYSKNIDFILIFLLSKGQKDKKPGPLKMLF